MRMRVRVRHVTKGALMVQPYPGGGRLPETETAQRPPAPDSVRHAVMAMYAGAAIGVIHAVLYLATASSTKAAYGRAHPALTAHKLTIDAHALVIEGAIAALIGAGLFIWIALKCRAGRNWARITGTVFFGIGVLSALTGLRAAESPVVRIWPLLTVVAGLVAVILLWQRSSSDYFGAAKTPVA
jgi:hypothetical protein